MVYKSENHFRFQQRFSEERAAQLPSFFLYRASPQFTSCPSNIPTTVLLREQSMERYISFYIAMKCRPL